MNISHRRYGWSRARYVYSLISGVGIFFLGSGVSVYHGISDIFSPPVLASLPLVRSSLHVTQCINILIICA
jgi:zinc transporter 9